MMVFLPGPVFRPFRASAFPSQPLNNDQVRDFISPISFKQSECLDPNLAGNT